MYHGFIRSVIGWNFFSKDLTCFVFSPVPTYYLLHGGYLISIYYYELSNSARFGLLFPFWARTWRITTCSIRKGLKRFRRANLIIKAFYSSPPFRHYLIFLSFFFFLILFIYLFIYGCVGSSFLCEGFLATVVASGGHSSSRCAGLSPSRPLLLQSTGSRRAGSAIVAHGPSRSAAHGILPDQGSNPCPLYRQADSQPLRHQGSPNLPF